MAFRKHRISKKDRQEVGACDVRKITKHRDLFLGLLFCFTGLFVYLWVNTLVHMHIFLMIWNVTVILNFNMCSCLFPESLFCIVYTCTNNQPFFIISQQNIVTSDKVSPSPHCFFINFVAYFVFNLFFISISFQDYSGSTSKKYRCYFYQNLYWFIDKSQRNLIFSHYWSSQPRAYYPLHFLDLLVFFNIKMIYMDF